MSKIILILTILSFNIELTRAQLVDIDGNNIELTIDQLEEQRFSKALLLDVYGRDLTKLVDIDGNVYKTTTIGNQTWIAENLKVSRFRNGDSIHLARSYEEFYILGEEKKPARFIEKDSSNNLIITYNWFAVNDPRGLAPAGWHIPHSVEWQILITTAGTRKNLKSTTGWLKNGNGTDSFGFNAKPSRSSCDCGWWWTASEIETLSRSFCLAYMIEIKWCEGQCEDDATNDCYIPNPSQGMNLSVRCIMN